MRLIDADELNYHKQLRVGKPVEYLGKYDVLKALTIDAVPVVRCKECTNGKENEFGAILCRLDNCVARNRDDFCSYGTRAAREEGRQ